ncbi:MAG: hypothetical protein ABWZ83_03860 [Mesorhizobium sp.]
MIDKNQIAAEQATFRSFANSYLRELNPGIPVFHRIGERNFDCVEISLPPRHAVLSIEIKSRSLVECTFSDKSGSARMPVRTGAR